jgi:hypothetical protein
MLILALALEFYSFLPGRKDFDESTWDEIVGSTVGCSTPSTSKIHLKMIVARLSLRYGSDAPQSTGRHRPQLRNSGPARSESPWNRGAGLKSLGGSGESVKK